MCQIHAKIDTYTKKRHTHTLLYGPDTHTYTRREIEREERERKTHTHRHTHLVYIGPLLPKTVGGVSAGLVIIII